MSVKTLQLILLTAPWFSLFFLDKNTIKRYMPTTIFTALLMTILFQIAYAYGWWEIHQSIVPWGYMIDASFAYGVFAVGTFWIFYLTSHRFALYVLSNLVMDALFSFTVFPLLTRIGIATLKNITAWQYFFVIFGLSFVIYGYHKWQEKIFIPAAPK